MTFPVWESGSEEAYWRAVELCMVEFFAYTEKAARARVADFRADLRRANLNQPQIVYHDEPINLASDLAGHPLNFDEAASVKYRKILETVAA